MIKRPTVEDLLGEEIIFVPTVEDLLNTEDVPERHRPLQNVVNLDPGPTLVSKRSEVIGLSSLFSKEVQWKNCKPNANYMDYQSNLNSKLRAIIIDWIVDQHVELNLLPQTLHITVDLIDQYLDKERNRDQDEFQLIGISAMVIASKYNEICPPGASAFVGSTDNQYSTRDVFEMAGCMLRKQIIVYPTAHQFLVRFLEDSANPSIPLRLVPCFAHYVIDLTLQEYSLLKYPPSVKAAAAIHIARMQMDELPIWNATLEYYTCYSKAALAPCVREIMEIIGKFQNGIKTYRKLSAVKRKYSKDRFLNVSLMKLNDVLFKQLNWYTLESNKQTPDPYINYF